MSEQQKNNDINFITSKIQVCEKCSLSLTRTNTVPGIGNIDSKIVFVGEGPGADEDATGEPFVGKAGQLLDKLMISNAKIEREKIYITNVVKCRPPKNRVPTDEEMNECSHYLESQLMIIRPKLIVTLGATSLSYFLKKQVQITKERGKFFDWYGGIKIFATVHPSYLLRNTSTDKGSPLWYARLDMTVIGLMYKMLEEKKEMPEIVSIIEEKMKAFGGT